MTVHVLISLDLDSFVSGLHTEGLLEFNRLWAIDCLSK